MPSAKIANLQTGEVVAKIAMDTPNTNGQGRRQNDHFLPNSYNCRINLDVKTIQNEEKQYPDMPMYYDFGGQKEAHLSSNYHKIYTDIAQLIQDITQTQSVHS
jgi:hypothetical protein